MFVRRFCVSFFIRDADQFLAKAAKQELAEAVRILAINLAQCQATYGTYLSKSTCCFAAAHNLLPELAKGLADGMKVLTDVLRSLASHETSDNSVH